jgi:hypothetical protein
MREPGTVGISVPVARSCRATAALNRPSFFLARRARQAGGKQMNFFKPGIAYLERCWKIAFPKRRKVLKPL